jgi:penicillin G amidase
MGHNYPRLRRRRVGGAIAMCAAVMLSVLAATGVSGAAVAVTAAPGSAAAVLSVPGAGAVRIVRDEYGVPHIFASTARALFYGEGYAVAQDRLWQAERLRLTGTGTIAAVYRLGGPRSVQGDLHFREYTGGQGHLQALVRTLPGPARIAVQAFSDGMNAWIGTAIRTHALPPEFALLHLTPRLWTPEDVIATWFVIESQYGSFGGDELTNASQLASWTAALGSGAAAQVFADTHWLDDPSSPTTIPAGAPGTYQAATPARPAAPAHAVRPARVSRGLLATVLRQQRATSRTLARIGQGSRWHSNAVVLSGRLTKDGAPLLLGGPQAEYSAPQTFMEVGLHGAGYDVTGVTIPGTVAVEIGVGARHAWSLTSGGTDNSDWYADTIDPAGHPGRYLFDGRWHPYACRTETIDVYHRPARYYRVCQGRHGPVYATSGHTALALRDAGAEGIDGTVTGFLAVDAARSLAQFAGALPRFAGSFNFLYADQGGNIAYWQVGHVPVRAPGDDPFLVHPGTGGDEWRGFLPWPAMPHVINPAQGLLANWNNKPEPGWPNSAYGFIDWGPVQRVQALTHQLTTLRPHTATAATLEHINRVAAQTAESPVGDEYNIAVHALLPRLLARVNTADDPRLPAVMALLSRWDGQRVDPDQDGLYDSPAVAVWQQWYPTFINRVFAATVGSGTSGKPKLDNTILTDMAVRLLEGPAAARPLHYDYLHGTPLSHAVTATLIQTLDTLTSRYHTPDTARWLLPDVYTTWQPLGLGTVPRTLWMNRGTYNQIVHLGRGGNLTAVNVVAPGESGLAASPHFADQLSLYATWHYKPMRLTRRDLTGHITSDTVLPVPGP